MPLYNLYCSKCDVTNRRLMTNKEMVAAICPECETPLVRVAQPPSTQTFESLDNGAMTKRVERLVNAEELYKNRDKKSE